MFTDWTEIWLSWQPDLCNRQKTGSEGQRWSATGEPLYCMKVSVFPLRQCIIVVRWKRQNSPSFSSRPHRGHKCVNMWIPKDETAANREIRASRNAPCVFPPVLLSLFTPSGLKGFCKGNCFSPPDTCCHLLSALSVFVIFSCRFLSSFVLSQLCACSIVPVSTKTRKSQIHSSHLYIPLKMSSQTARCFSFQFPLMCIAAEYILGNTVNTEQSIICQCKNDFF